MFYVEGVSQSQWFWTHNLNCQSDHNRAFVVADLSKILNLANLEYKMTANSSSILHIERRSDIWITGYCSQIKWSDCTINALFARTWSKQAQIYLIAQCNGVPFKLPPRWSTTAPFEIKYSITCTLLLIDAQWRIVTFSASGTRTSIPSSSINCWHFSTIPYCAAWTENGKLTQVIDQQCILQRRQTITKQIRPWCKILIHIAVLNW